MTASDGERPVAAAAGDPPGVAVGDEPVAVLGAQAPLVEAGDDQVTDPGAVAVGQHCAALFDESAADQVGAGPGRQGGGGGLGVGHQQRDPSLRVAVAGGPARR